MHVASKPNNQPMWMLDSKYLHSQTSLCTSAIIHFHLVGPFCTCLWEKWHRSPHTWRKSRRSLRTGGQCNM